MPSFIGQKVCLDESSKMAVASHDCISGLPNGLKFCQLLSCLDEAMQTRKISPLFLTLFTLHDLLLLLCSPIIHCVWKSTGSLCQSQQSHIKKCILVSTRMRSCILCSILL